MPGQVNCCIVEGKPCLGRLSQGMEIWEEQNGRGTFVLSHP